MKQKSSIIFIIGIIVVSIGVSIGTQYQKEHNRESKELASSGLEERVLTVGDSMVQVEVAQTKQQRMKGLSYRTELAEGRGMFFIFDDDGKHAIWMKDMQFTIDIIWIDAKMKVIHIEQAVAPNTYPQSFAPPVPAQYVLEVPAGYTQRRIEIGDTVALD